MHLQRLGQYVLDRHARAERRIGVLEHHLRPAPEVFKRRTAERGHVLIDPVLAAKPDRRARIGPLGAQNQPRNGRLA